MNTYFISELKKLFYVCNFLIRVISLWFESCLNKDLILNIIWKKNLCILLIIIELIWLFYYWNIWVKALHGHVWVKALHGHVWVKALHGHVWVKALHGHV